MMSYLSEVLNHFTDKKKRHSGYYYIIHVQGKIEGGL